MLFHPSNSAEAESRRRFFRDVVAFTGWSFLGAVELVRSSSVAVAGDPKNADPAWGTVKGRIVYDGEVPERKPVDLEKSGIRGDDLKWFSSMGPILNEEWVVDKKSKAVQWVFVWLLPDDPKGAALSIHESRKTIADKEKIITIDQKPQGYEHHTVAARAGQDLVMKNSGPVAHVFKMAGSNNPEMNQAMPAKAEIKVPNLLAERGPVEITCPPHPWERLWLRVFDHPFFAVTKADGTFELPLVPTGTCRIVVWHEAIGFKNGKEGRNGSQIKVTGAAVTDLGDITIKPRT